MAENKNAAPTEEYNDDGTKNPDYVAPKDESESGQDTQKLGNDDKGKEGEDDGFKDEIDPANPPQIPVRLSTAQHIIARKNNKINKLESKLKEGEDGYVPPNPDEDDGDELNLSDDASKAIESKVNKVIAPLLGKIASEADEKEMQDLISSEPEAKNYVNHIKAYMAHEAYKGVSPVVIFHHLAYGASKAIGAKKKNAADFEARQSRSGGRAIVNDGAVDGLPTADQITDMSDAEFAKMEEEVLQGKFLKK